jgi:hypothetical protein
MTPTMPTTSGARISMATQMFTPALVDTTTV